MQKTILIALFVAFLFKATPSLAWGAQGHKLVAQTAKAYLNKGIQDSVIKYLGNMSFESAAVWMDEVRKDPFFDYMKTWHYVDFEKDKTYVDTKTPDIVNELEKAILQLEERKKYTPDEVKMNLKLLFHLVGDLHMPLHTGYKDDKGGNTINVKFLGNNTNLHRVWDTEMIESDKNFNDKLSKMAAKVTKAQIRTIGKIDVSEWMNQSRTLLPEVYNFSNGVIDQAYVDKNIPVVETQILNAGIRLASVLNEVFGK